MKKTYLLLILSLLPFLLFAETNSTTCILPTTILFKSGMKDTAKTKNITTLQMILYANGYLASKPTGSFGPATKKAVEAFQKEKKLKVTGITGKYTIEELNTLGCASFAKVSPASKKVSEVAPTDTKVTSVNTVKDRTTLLKKDETSKDTITLQSVVVSTSKVVATTTIKQVTEVKPGNSLAGSPVVKTLTAADQLHIEDDIIRVNGTEKDKEALTKLILEFKAVQDQCNFDCDFGASDNGSTKKNLDTTYALIQQKLFIQSKIDDVYFAMYKANNNTITTEKPFASGFYYANFNFPQQRVLTENDIFLANQTDQNESMYYYYYFYLNLKDVSQSEKDAIKIKLNELEKVYKPKIAG